MSAEILARCEREVASAIVVRGDSALAEVLQRLDAEDFATLDARMVIEAAKRIAGAGGSITLPGLVLAMKEAGSSRSVDALYALLKDRWGSVEALPEYVARVREASDLRRAESHLGALGELLASGTATSRDATRLLERAALDMRSREDEEEVSVGRDPVRRALEQTVDQPFLPTSFGELELPRGGGRGFTGICGRPGMGKTAFVLGSVVAPARLRQERVVVFSVEMSVEDCERRQLAAVAGLSIKDVHMSIDYTGEHHADILHAADRLVGDAYAIDESAAPTPSYIRAQVDRYASAWGGVDLVVIDHFGLVRHEGHGSERLDQRMARSSAVLRRLQKEVGCALVVVSQLNRDIERRVDKRPQMADLRECGALEEDAGLWLGLYRPSVYDEASAEPDEVVVMKNRNGATRRYRAAFDGARMRWEATNG